jgi:hypothetical protein
VLASPSWNVDMQIASGRVVDGRVELDGECEHRASQMKLGFVCGVATLLSIAVLHGQSPPSIDHHQHLFSPATAALAPGLVPVSAADLVKLLDDAGIRRAAVFSVAYQFGDPNRPSVDDESP